jgi:predicted RNA-binding protein YlxR (DUF448 family)
MGKHIPQRTCVGCREVEAKRAMMRIVRTPDGHVLADPTGKRAGRGAYLHKECECWEAALGRRGGLEHALKLTSPMLPEDRAALEQMQAVFPPRSVARAAETRAAPAIN